MDELLRKVRAQAVADTEQYRQRCTDDCTKKILQTRGKFGEIKEKITMARKPSMRTVQHFVCDQCDTEIVNPTDGFVIHGNIYAADPSCLGGLIGNNFPLGDKSFTGDDVRKQVLCYRCFAHALNLDNKVSEEELKICRLPPHVDYNTLSSLPPENPYQF